MKIGINTNVFMNFDIRKTLETVGKIGFEGIELARVHDFDLREVKEIKDLSRSLGLEIYGVQGGKPYTDLEFTMKRIKLASSLEANFVNIGPGVHINSIKEMEEGWNKTLETYSRLRDYSRGLNIELAIEPEPWPPFNPPYIVDSYLGKVRDILTKFPEFKVILDITHTYVFREPLEKILREMGDKIAIVHVSDQIDRIHFHLIPGHGKTDFTAVLKMLEDFGFRGFLSIEIYPYFSTPSKAAQESYEYLTGLLHKLDIPR